jgi:hemolysin-activating ACP:hemolysin acyltransferase
MRLISFFSTVKTAALYLVPIKSYSKNTHPPSFLKWALINPKIKSNHKGLFS